MDVSVDVTTGRDGVEQTSVDGLHGGLEVLLDDTVELECLEQVRSCSLLEQSITYLTCGQLESTIAVLVTDSVHVQPLLGCANTSG